MRLTILYVEVMQALGMVTDRVRNDPSGCFTSHRENQLLNISKSLFLCEKPFYNNVEDEAHKRKNIKNTSMCWLPFSIYHTSE